MPKGFLFDCDGVLLDSIGAWHALDDRLAEEAGLTITPADRDVLNASTLDEAAKYFHEHYGVGESTQAVCQRFNDFLLDYYENDAQANPGSLEFVEAVSEAGLPMCVLSSSPMSFLEAGLTRAGFMPLIDTVLSVEMLPFKKRDVRLYPHVCELIGANLTESWIFDDSFYALQTAQQAGVRGVGVFSTDECGTHEQLAKYSEIVVDDFTELDVRNFIDA